MDATRFKKIENKRNIKKEAPKVDENKVDKD